MYLLFCVSEGKGQNRVTFDIVGVAVRRKQYLHVFFLIGVGVHKHAKTSEEV